jgi:hypothetical protein
VDEPRYTTKRGAGTSDASDAPIRARVARRGRQAESQHRLLEDSFHRVSDAFAGASLTETRASFLQLRAALEAHIALEDRAFFPTLYGLKPALTGELELLSRDHEQFRLDLEHLYDLLAVGAREAFAKDFARFSDSVHEHEEREEALFARTLSPGGETDSA